MKRYFLNGNLQADEVIGWDNLTTTLKLDRTLKARLKTQDGTFQFRDTSYDYLWNIRVTQGYCEEIQFEIQSSKNGNQWTNFYKGIIFSKDIIFDEMRKLAIVKPKDDSYYARIENNKSQECLPHVGLSKNEVDISAYVPSNRSINYFKPSDGTYYGLSSRAYSTYDIFKFMIKSLRILEFCRTNICKVRRIENHNHPFAKVI